MSISTINHYLESIEQYFEKNQFAGNPKELYEPVNYILSLKGKRIRPLLVTTACDMFSGNVEDALSTAYAMEVFHNFTLVHDDIMDAAQLRRGQATVHEKYGTNTAILSGDVMLMLAYQYLQKAPATTVPDLIKLFTDTGIQIVEGQQMDMNFESRNEVSESEYLKMIEYKTSVLLAACLQSGAIIANTNSKNQNLMYQLGINLGLSFQIKDDYLDAFGDSDKVGKVKGGDIRQNKKSYLLIAAYSRANNAEKQQLLQLQNIEDLDKKVEQTLSFLTALQIDKMTLEKSEQYFQAALQNLQEIEVNEDKKQVLTQLVHAVNNREY